MTHAATDRSQTNRLFFSALPAIGVTVLIFAGMQALVKVDEIVVEPTEFRTLSIIVPVIEDTEPEKIKDAVLKKITAVPPPKVTPVQNSASTLVSWEISPPAPFEVSLPRGQIERLSEVAVGWDRQMAEAVRRPVPAYPEAALKKGLSGQCDVEFSIDHLGRPYGVEAKCSDDVFRQSAEQSVRKALFAAKTKNGVPVGQENLVYPLVYEFNAK